MRSGNIYYYDLNTGQRFADKASLTAPIDAPSGPTPKGKNAGVKAYVFSCGDCSDETQQFVAWMERHIPAAKELREKGDAARVDIDGLIDALSTGLEVSDDDGQTWKKMHPIHYIQYQMDKRRALCGNGNGVACQPP